MLKPLHKNVVLKKMEVEKQTQSGIILMDTSKERPSMAEVVAIGDNCETTLNVRDKVVYKEYSGTKVNMDDMEYIVIEEEDILAIVE